MSPMAKEQKITYSCPGEYVWSCLGESPNNKHVRVAFGAQVENFCNQNCYGSKNERGENVSAGTGPYDRCHMERLSPVDQLLAQHAVSESTCEKLLALVEAQQSSVSSSTSGVLHD